jgi:CubicO group peptidase (beta-lactamase class C family)
MIITSREKKLRKRFTATAAIFLTGLLGWGSPAAASTGDTAELARLAQADVDAGAPGVAIRVDDGSHRPVSIAEQAAWTRADHRLSADDQFRMGSNTKTMVATVALQLVAERRLRLSDPVDKWLPGAVVNGRTITVRMLLNHTSGLPDYFFDLSRGRFDPDVLDAVTGKVQRAWTPQQLLAVARKYPVLFAPGTSYEYSNTNYIALGLILERVTGESVTRLLQSRILGPLGLHDSYLASDGRSRDGDRLAHGYEPDAAHIDALLAQFGTPPGTRFYGPARPGHVDVTGDNPVLHVGGRRDGRHAAGLGSFPVRPAVRPAAAPGTARRDAHHRRGPHQQRYGGLRTRPHALHQPVRNGVGPHRRHPRVRQSELHRRDRTPYGLGRHYHAVRGQDRRAQGQRPAGRRRGHLHHARPPDPGN